MSFDWTPDGLKLLEFFNNKIKYQYGGIRNLYYNCRHEARPASTMPNKTTPTTDLSIVLNNWDKMTAKDIAPIIGKSPATVFRRVKLLGLKKNKATSYANGQKYKVCGWVLNFETGIYYENMKLCADAHAMKKRTMQNYLRGERKNKTNCKLV